MKKARTLLGIIFVCLFAVSYSACDNPFAKLPTVGTESGIMGYLNEHSEQLTIYSDIELISQEMFGDVRISSEEFLYNLDDSPDFIYVDFEDSGYAIFAADSLELLEYSANGSLPYQDTRARRYYNGPKAYLNKEGEQFINIITAETFSLSVNEAKARSQKTRDIFNAMKNRCLSLLRTLSIC